MTSVHSRGLPPPLNWQDFERLCYDLFSRMWATNDAEMHGRTGQPQAGVDVYGTDRLEGKRAGVQCKGKDQTYGGVITEAELRSEIEKAKNFKPALEVFTLVTTAPNDATIQAVARQISHDHVQRGLFEVRVIGWDTLRQRITDYPQLVQKHFADFASVDVVAKVDEVISVTLREGEVTRQAFADFAQGLLAGMPDRADAQDPLKAKMDSALKLMEGGMLKAALHVFEQLWREEGELASGRNRYRLLANQGSIHLALDDQPTAVDLFERAYREDPEWPGARAFLATARLLQNNREAAYGLATGVIAQDPTVEQAIVVMIDAAPNAMSTAEVEAMIPINKRNMIAAVLGLSLRARRQGNLQEAEAYARRALQEHEGDWRAMAAVAESLFEPISHIEALAFTHQLPSGLQRSFDEALQWLRASWAILKRREDTIRGVHVAANLICALDLLGELVEADEVLHESLQIAPRYPPLLRRYAQRLVDASDWDSVIEALDKIEVSEIEPADLVLRAQILLRTDRAQEALAATERLMDCFTDERFIQLAAAINLDAAAALGKFDDVLENLLKRWPDSILIKSAAIAALPKDDERTTVLVAGIINESSTLSDPRDRFYAADALYRAKKYAEAADLYDGCHGLQKDHPAIVRRLKALYFADRRADARSLFDSLSPQLQSAPAYAEIGVAIYDRSGMLPEARQLLERWLAQQENLGVRLMWLRILQRTGDVGILKEWLEDVDVALQGEPSELIQLALMMDHHLGDTRSLPIAYRALRDGYEDLQIHLGYAIGLFLMGRVGRTHIPKPEIVDTDVAVILQRIDGTRRLNRIIETESDPKIARDEIGPDHELAKRLIGKSIGDIVEMVTAASDPVQYEIVDLQNKYVFAHSRTLEQLPILFPENRAFGTFELTDRNGEENLEPILGVARDRRAAFEELNKVYASGLAPIAMLARVSGISPLAVWESLRLQPEAEILVSNGTAEEFTHAHAVLSKDTRAIIDAVTLYGIVQLGVDDIVIRAVDDLAITQTSIDLLRVHLMDQRGKVGTRQGTFGFDGSQYQMVELTEAKIAEGIRSAESAVAFAERLRLLPAEATREIAADSREVFDSIDKSFLDTILAAQGDGRALLCDDRAMRVLGSEAVGIATIWTQVACKHAAECGDVTAEEFLDTSIVLAEAKYVFTMIGPHTFLRELGRNGWVISSRIKALIRHLVRPTNEPSTVQAVLADLMIMGWGQKISVPSYKSLFGAIFTALQGKLGDASSAGLVQEAFDRLDATLWARSRFKVYRRDLRSSTNARPIDDLFAEGDRVAAEILNRIAEALSEAAAAVKFPSQ